MRYAYGDSALASERLELLHTVFAPSTRPFLQQYAPPHPTLAVDLGCGPGVCTAFLREVTGAAWAVGLDSSPSYIALAVQRGEPGVEFFVHDVTRVPFPTPPADLLFARFLLSHLSNVPALLTNWATQLRAGGRLCLDEVEGIETRSPLFREYLGMVAALHTHLETQLYVGPVIDCVPPVAGLTRIASEVRRLEVANAAAAQLFRRNFQTLRSHPFVQASYSASWLDRVDRQLTEIAFAGRERSNIRWSMRQVTFERD